MKKKILFIIIILVILSRLSGDLLNRILGAAGNLWEQIMNVLTSIITVS
jgi:hypothetical protein